MKLNKSKINLIVCAARLALIQKDRQLYHRERASQTAHLFTKKKKKIIKKTIDKEQKIVYNKTIKDKKERNKMSRLYVMVGLPGAGKDYFINKNKEENDVVISSDDIRAELGDVNDQSRNVEVFATMYERINKALAEGKTVWANATFLIPRYRKTVIKCGLDNNAEIYAIYVKSSVERCIANQALRDRKVPTEVIKKMNNRLTPPKMEEGFNGVVLWEYLWNEGERG